jgi:hypothetical protein
MEERLLRVSSSLAAAWALSSMARMVGRSAGKMAVAQTAPVSQMAALKTFLVYAVAVWPLKGLLIALALASQRHRLRGPGSRGAQFPASYLCARNPGRVRVHRRARAGAAHAGASQQKTVVGCPLRSVADIRRRSDHPAHGRTSPGGRVLVGNGKHRARLGALRAGDCALRSSRASPAGDAIWRRQWGCHLVQSVEGFVGAWR